MRWEKLAKPLEEIGKWFLNIGLIVIAGLIVQPIVKGKGEFVVKGLLTAIIFGFAGFVVILISELLKGGSKNGGSL